MKGDDPLQAIMRADVGFYMTEDVLAKVDRMSMAHSLEVRSPLLAKSVVELAFSIPSHLKVDGGKSKALLRRLAERYLPGEVHALPKRGFHMPADDWFRGRLRETFQREVLEDSGALEWIDPKTLNRLWNEHQSGTFHHGSTLWALWSLKCWTTFSRPSDAVEQPAELTRVGASS